MLTGLLPFEHGVRDNVGFALKESQVTLASLLREAGFKTAGFASSYVLRPSTRIGIGFDQYDASVSSKRQDTHFAQLWRSGDHTIDMAADWCAANVPKNHPKLLLFLHLFEPHTPYEPPEPYRTLHAQAPYDGEIAHVDHLLGTFFSSLKVQGLYDRSLIILTSDHGEGLGEHGEDEHGVFLYNSALRVPLIVRMPEAGRAGERVRAPVQTVDILPTVLKWLSIRSPVSYRGQSLLDAAIQRADRKIYSESLFPLYHFGWSELHSITDSRRKYIRAPREELYDLVTDPAESANIAAGNAPDLGAYQHALGELIGQTTGLPEMESNAEEIQKLRALGYVGSAGVGVGRSGQPKADPKDRIQDLQALKRGLSLAASGNNSGAISVLRSLVEKAPDMVDAELELGRLLARGGNRDEAMRRLRHAATMRSANPTTLADIAPLIWDLGDPVGALALLDDALRLNPSDASAHELRGRVLEALKDRDGALLAFGKALQLDPTLCYANYASGLAAMGEDRLAEAVELLRRADKSAAEKPDLPPLPWLHFYVGIAMLKMQRHDDAMGEFRLDLERHPENTGSRINLARLLVQAGRRSDALRLFDTPYASNLEGYGDLVNFLLSIGEPTRARELTEECFRRFGRRPPPREESES